MDLAAIGEKKKARFGFVFHVFLDFLFFLILCGFPCIPFCREIYGNFCVLPEWTSRRVRLGLRENGDLQYRERVQAKHISSQF